MKRQLVLPVVMAGLLTACATPQNNYDPLESINRPIYRFNTAVDKAVLRPAAQAYTTVVPGPARTGVHNFFSNIDDIFVGLNNLLQGKPKKAGSDVGRLLINSTLGVFGLVDVASKVGLEKHDEDFGQTLGKWGVGSGPYLVIPIFGPTTARDSVNVVAAQATYGQIDDIPVRNSLTALRVLDARAQLLGVDQVIDQANGTDTYAFMRDAYLERREFEIRDGEASTGQDDNFDPGPTGETPASAPASGTGTTPPAP